MLYNGGIMVQLVTPVEDFPLLQSIQTISWGHPSSYSMSNTRSFLWHRAAMAWNSQLTFIYYRGE